MFNTIIQLYIERRLSGAKPYLASHPDLGVPLGVFNYKDEPNKEARIKSIKKYGIKGNPRSYELAKKYGIKNPLPSYQDDDLESIKKQNEELKKQIELLEKRNNASSSTPDYGGVKGQIQDAANYYTQLETEVKQTNLSMQETVNLIFKVGTGGAGIEAQKQRILALRELNALADSIRKNLTNNIGMTEGMMDMTTTVITNASGHLEGFNLTANDVMETLADTMTTVGRQLSIPPHVLADMVKIDSLFGEVSADFVANFDKIGSGAYQATQAIQNTVLVAQNMGLTVSTLLPEVEKNISKINTYGFKDGVAGLTQMVAQGQRLGLTMDEVLKVSDKAFTPEGAIDMAAQLQMIGGAAGELLDPFQLMYMAQNDVEGLQDAIVKSTESAVTFNEETGEFGLTPSDRMRLQKTADAMGISYDTLAETAIRNAKRTQALAQFDVGGNIDEQTQELIAGMAEVGPGGKMSITVEDEKGQAQTYLLEELNDLMQTNPKLLESIQEQANKDAMNIEDVQKQQLTVNEAMEAHTASINNILIKAAADGAFGGQARDFAAALADVDFGAEDIANKLIGASQLVSSEIGGPEGAANLLDQQSQTTRGLLNANVMQPNDFLLEPGKSLQTAAAGEVLNLIEPAANDTILGGTDILNSISNTQNAISNMTTTNMGGGGGPGEVKLTGTLELKLDGRSMNVSADDIFRALSPPSYERLALELSNTVYGTSS